MYQDDAWVAHGEDVCYQDHATVFCAMSVCGFYFGILEIMLNILAYIEDDEYAASEHETCFQDHAMVVQVNLSLCELVFEITELKSLIECILFFSVYQDSQNAAHEDEAWYEDRVGATLWYVSLCVFLCRHRRIFIELKLHAAGSGARCL